MQLPANDTDAFADVTTRQAWEEGQERRGPRDAGPGRAAVDAGEWALARVRQREERIRKMLAGQGLNPKSERKQATKRAAKEPRPELLADLVLGAPPSVVSRRLRGPSRGPRAQGATAAAGCRVDSPAATPRTERRRTDAN